MAETTRQMCTCCGKNRKLIDFYSSQSPIYQYYEKITICKACLVNMVDVDNMRSVANALKMIDKPLISHLWESTIAEASKKDSNIFRIYMKNIVMPQNKDKSWSDSDFGDKQEILLKVKPQGDEKLDEDKIYSKEWLGNYYPSEIDHLNDYLDGSKHDFKILTKSHNDYAKKIAKASLHMDKCFQDIQDSVKGSEKRYKEAKEVFDTLSKSAQFSEDRRGTNDVSLGSFSQITEMVENKTYVYEHKNDLTKDNYDKLIDDFSHIEKSV